MAHGGNPEWNAQVASLREQLKPQVPVEVALGMADPSEIQQAVDKLKARNPSKIVAVPLFVNSASEVMEQTRYVLGIAEKPSEVMRTAAAALRHAHGPHSMFSEKRVAVKEPLVLTAALDDHPIVQEILLERARALSREPYREVVVLVGHGPVDERANKAWSLTMGRLAGAVREKGKFKAVLAATLRDDASPEVRAKAVASLREMVSAAGRAGGVLVVPCLIARGGIEGKVKEALRGLDYAWDGRTILPHPGIARWIAESAAAGAKKDDMRRYP